MPHTGVWTELSSPHIRVPKALLKQITGLHSHGSDSVVLGWGRELAFLTGVQVWLLLVPCRHLKSPCARPREVTEGFGSWFTWKLRSKTETSVWCRERKQEDQSSPEVNAQFLAEVACEILRCPEPGEQLDLEEVETESRVSGFWSL